VPEQDAIVGMIVASARGANHCSMKETRNGRSRV
jgi:hypothetical protein